MTKFNVNYRSGPLRYRRYWRHAAMFLATGGYLGYVPWAPGTLGSLIGMPIVFALSRCHWLTASAVTVLIVLAAVWAAGAAEKMFDVKDPRAIVIDEIAGICVAMVAVRLDFATGAAGFLLFRLFDIWKPQPIRFCDRKISGGWGIVMDDVAAGILVRIILAIVPALTG